ncbi:MAG: protease [Ignavibacteriales bacterium CG18_big_fil_WC_8_21_14_2_50_31_20]|nr:MAG: protease [Ignavibacteriales bacterium CG18_big_fil_WC_8_21_14_2_50_31_20]
MNIKKPELLAGAGDWKMLRTAVKYGANAIYFGVDALNLRAKASNFALDELEEVVNYLHENNVDAHLTVNAVVYDDQNEKLDLVLKEAKRCKVDYVIAWDMAIIEKCLEYELPLCISTQASVSNSGAAKMYKRLGAKRIVLARECTLEQIKEIKSNVDIEIETFVHGAMCVAVSGRCFMSHHAFGQSANTGECLQNCRREYEIHDTSGETSFIIGTDYVMSPKDMNTIEFIDELIEAGIDSFKIEGRKRSPEYIAKAVSNYRKAIDLYFEGNLNKEVKQEMFEDLSKVYNRGFSAGFYHGIPSGADYTERYGNQATIKKMYVGKVLNYYKQSKIAHIKLEAGEIELNDILYITGNTTGFVETTLQSLMKDEKQVDKAIKGEEVTFFLNELIRTRDQVYKVVPA